MHSRISQAHVGAAVGPTVPIGTTHWGKHSVTMAPRGRSNTKGALFTCIFYKLKKKR